MQITHISLGSFCLRVRSNLKEPYGKLYFSKEQYLPETTRFNRQITAIDAELKEDQEFLLPESLLGYRDLLLRSGYFTSHYFGAPVISAWYGENVLLIGRNLDLIIWRFYVKLFLTLDGYNSNKIHLKAASILCGTYTYILIGLGGAGKTTFLNAMMEEGATFISNTHILVDPEFFVDGICSNIRFRNVPKHTRFNFEKATIGHLSNGDRMVDPFQLYSGRVYRAVSQIRGIIILSKRTDGNMSIEKVSPEDAFNLMRNCSLGFVFYDLKHDIFDLYKYSYEKFLEFISISEKSLRHICQTVPSTLISADIHNENVRKNIYIRLCTGIQ